MNSHLHGQEDIQGRLVKLEQQNRQLKKLGVAALVIVTSLLVMGQASQKKTVEADEFILRDSSGNVRARLSMNAAPTLGPEMVLFDEKGKARVKLDGGIGSFIGGTVSVFDGQGRQRGVFSADDQGAFLSLLDLKGLPSTLLKPGQAEANEFILKDDIGNVRARLFVTAKKTANMTLPGTADSVPVTLNPSPMLALYDEKEQTRLMLNDSDITFLNSEGHVGGSLGNGTLLVAGDGGSGALVAPGIVSTFDEQGFSAVLGVQSLETPHTGETHKTSAASLVLFDKNKSVLWKAP